MPGERENFMNKKIEIVHCTKTITLYVTVYDAKTEEEVKNISMLWEEEFGILASPLGPNPEVCCFCITITSRREYSLLPMLIRKALKFSYGVSVHSSVFFDNYSCNCKIDLDSDPENFWKIIALSQMYKN